MHFNDLSSFLISAFPCLREVHIAVFFVDGGQSVHDLHGFHRNRHQPTDEVCDIHRVIAVQVGIIHDIRTPKDTRSAVS